MLGFVPQPKLQLHEDRAIAHTDPGAKTIPQLATGSVVLIQRHCRGSRYGKVAFHTN
ncbi:hypothetical protein H6F50_21810 [Coleofasciculus sp. FACHB-712]|uniref:hypothetical protein n=1 Tax=Cyanophyceae TaxID=3028117 RepID=UPI001687F4A3|nr:MULTISPECIES: hypothetical protein [unclassified Coleofasciculus]MBD1944958.1 hypothetical protein [Coleofasciculus sp. FACHB-712]MBD2087359.1 hypothetical protein [Coleofasciculus sp. FACHB-542]MBD2541418.1 hypothetical protein [Coleofasciculus sp. FACHB-SPT36]